jgi:hypothetical protein
MEVARAVPAGGFIRTIYPANRASSLTREFIPRLRRLHFDQRKIIGLPPLRRSLLHSQATWDIILRAQLALGGRTVLVMQRKLRRASQPIGDSEVAARSAVRSS